MNESIKLANESVQQVQEQISKYLDDSGLSGHSALTRPAMHNMPSEWVQVSIKDVCEFNPKVKLNDDLDVAFMPMSAVPKEFHGRPEYEIKKWHEVKKGYTQFKDGDALFAKITPCFENGKACVIEQFPNGWGAGSTEFHVLRPINQCVHPKLLLSLVKTREFLVKGAVNMTGSVGHKRVPKEFVENYPLPLPPLAEQQQIAAKLDELLAQVDNLKTRLDNIPKILKRFRQSVLAAAVSGKLTEDWRIEHKYNAIINISEKCFEERKSVLKKAKKPVALEDAPIIELPISWSWNSIDEACLKITDGTHHSPKSYLSGDYMYVTSKNVREGYINLSNITFVDQKTHSEIYSRCDVVKGDVLYVKDGANTGLSCVNNISEEISLLSSVGVLRPTNFITAKYLEHYLNSPIGRKVMLDMIGGTAIMRLTLTKIMRSPLSIPPIEEQTEIVARVEQLFTYADQIEQRVKDAQSRVNHLTQAILTKAFRGELTAEWRAQNPDLISGENSAEALLARIQEERETVVVTKKTVKKEKA